MIYRVSKSTKDLKGSVTLPTSKSESNRLLIIRSLCSTSFNIKNLSSAEDTQALKNILEADNNHQQNSPITHNVGHAGTSMRFLAAYFSVKPGIRILTGSDRMKERPIKILVDALRQMGAKIEYLEKEGFAPLKIEGTELTGRTLEIEGNISSQYASALLLIAPCIKDGFTIRFKPGIITSTPYIKMTVKIMERMGVKAFFEKDHLSVVPQQYNTSNLSDLSYEVEKDWSCASYWYSMAALADEVDLTLIGLKKNSLQGDAMLPDLYTLFGVKTEFIDNGIRLTKSSNKVKNFAFNFFDCPDLAQTIAVTSAAVQIPALLNGLETLKIKETDRVLALQNELKKMGVTAVEKNPGLLEITDLAGFKITSSSISTYNDHRMAMAFAPLALLNEIKIENPEVVKKSYPDFWKDLKSAGFTIKED